MCVCVCERDEQKRERDINHEGEETQKKTGNQTGVRGEEY